MTTLTSFQLTPLGLFHTLVSLAAVVAACLALWRERGISPRTALGRTYLVSLLISTVTGFPIFRHGGFGPPHALGVITLALLAVAAAGEWTGIFGRAAAYIKTLSYSATVLCLMIPAVTETLTRVPLGAPIAASQEAPLLKGLNLALLALFLAGAWMQCRRLREARNR